jgi:hypothetical protein
MQVLLYCSLAISVPRAGAQISTPPSVVPRQHLSQNELCCFDIRFVKPIYPTAARLARLEGVVKLTLVIAPDNTIADLQPVSGNPLLVDSAMNAVRHWRFIHMFGGVVTGQAMPEIEVPLEFTFEIEEAPKPAYLYLTNRSVVRADEVREFTDGFEYTAHGRTHHLSSVTEILPCRFGTLPRTPEEACIASGGPPVLIRVVPLLARRSAASHPMRTVAELVAELQVDSTSDRSLEQLELLGAAHPEKPNEVKQYLAEHLPALIDQGPGEKIPGTNRRRTAWLNEVALAGFLEISTTIPALAKWLGVQSGGSGISTGYSEFEVDDFPAAVALTEIGEPAIPELQKVLIQGSLPDRDIASKTLYKIGSPSAFMVLHDAAKTERDPHLADFLKHATPERYR